MDKKYGNKNIVITGASKGIGKSTAYQLAARGANLFLAARSGGLLKEIQSDLTTKFPEIAVYYTTVDITDKKSIQKAVETINNSFGGRVDGLINVAGAAYPEYFHKMPEDQFEKSMNLIYLGTVHFCYYMYDLLHDGGFVALTSSVVGYMGVFGYTSYAGPKFALIGFAESLRQELAGRNIKVSVLCPPDTDTPGYEEENKTKPYETAALSESAKLMSADEVAKRFLAALRKGKFMILVNFESKLFYRLHAWFPGLVNWVMMQMIKGSQKKKAAGK